MSADPFDTELVIARVKAPELPDLGLRFVGGGADYASIRRLGDHVTPALYVLLAREKALETKTGHSMPGQQTRIAQDIEVHFALVYALKNYRQLEGDDLRNEVRQQVGKVRGRLLGWTPPVDGGRACQLIAGDLSAYDNAVALWTDLFRTKHVIKAEIAP